ncbi:hypothetical protein NQ314_003912 [Rhamnusium bicolor]|uniref:THAP-type domain-containing protein n=1 Tax=Rhamnusium bicolor TaxID=1586634 RepID=A0AAV8ZMP0_9CUCU|nr:hypothetical protein NQ314_003912 [Rhamnusium bicolor]
MVKYCCAYGCTNEWTPSGNKKFHRFPFKRPDILKQWIQAVHLQNFKPTGYTVICSDHFINEDYLESSLNRNLLKQNAVPSVFKYPSHIGPSHSSKRRTLIRKVESTSEGSSSSADESVTSFKKTYEAATQTPKYMLGRKMKVKIQNLKQQVKRRNKKIKNMNDLIKHLKDDITNDHADHNYSVNINDYASFTKFVSRGKLYFPSLVVFEIVKYCEKAFKAEILMGYMGKVDIKKRILNMVLQHFLPKIKAMFLPTHPVSISEDLHEVQMIKYIAITYASIRITTHAKKTTMRIVGAEKLSAR